MASALLVAFAAGQACAQQIAPATDLVRLADVAHEPQVVRSHSSADARASCGEATNDTGGPERAFYGVYENDLDAHGHDYDYTNGLMVGMVSSGKDAENFIIGLTRKIDWLVPGVRLFCFNRENAQFDGSIVNLMFTPRDLTLTEPDPHDRPYAGISLLSLGVFNIAKAREPYRRFDQFVVRVGMIGPSSGAGDLQTWWHDEIGGVHPAGWDAQIPDRVLYNIAFQRTNVWSFDLFEAFSLDLMPHYGASLGNTQTYLNAGATARIGWRIPEDYGPPRIAPSLPGASYFAAGDGFSFYAFAGFEQRYLTYDITLDERPARGESFVHRLDWVDDSQLGAVAQFGVFRLGYTRVWRSRQFRSQPDEDSFGVWSLTIRGP
jgi:hypothetical protein